MEVDRLMKKFEKVFREIEEAVVRDIEREIERIRSAVRSYEHMLAPTLHHEGFMEPLYNVVDEGDRIVIRVDLPYVEEGSIDVKFVNNKLVLHAKLKDSYRFEGWSHRMGEVRFQEFRLALDLPPNVDPSNAKVRFRRGVLEIVIPKI